MAKVAKAYETVSQPNYRYHPSIILYNKYMNNYIKLVVFDLMFIIYYVYIINCYFINILGCWYYQDGH